ncbi:MAG TPA: hypothetical protein VJI98_03340 [Candidatus Nanoarchaeia archaeon]|nr:hypothetical protein [Candidatus Nanoarchaeia archaeon]
MPKKKIQGDQLIKDAVPQIRIKYKDIFDLNEFYKALREWFNDKQWVDEEDKNEHWETYYGERLAGGSREIWWWWRLFKKAPDSDYLKYYIDIDVHCLGIVDTEVIVNGNKLKVNKGEIDFYMKGMIEKTYEAEFEKNWLLREVKDIFSRRIYRKNLEQRRKELYQEMYELNNFIKQWLKLKRYLPYEEAPDFFSSYAWPSHLKEK